MRTNREEISEFDNYVSILNSEFRLPDSDFKCSILTPDF
jgi:hypothetical protein